MLRANQFPLMDKKFSKEIMKRLCLRNEFINTKIDIDKKAYNKQRNYVKSTWLKTIQLFLVKTRLPKYSVNTL